MAGILEGTLSPLTLIAAPANLFLGFSRSVQVELQVDRRQRPYQLIRQAPSRARRDLLNAFLI